MPEHYLLIASILDIEGRTVSPREIMEALTARQAWYLWERTPYRSRYKAGDRVVFYLAGKGYRQFAGTATVAGPVVPMERGDRDVAESLGLFEYTEKLLLRDIQLWKEPRPVLSLVPELGFIVDKKNYGLYFRMGALRIPREDYERIIHDAD